MSASVMALEAASRGPARGPGQPNPNGIVDPPRSRQAASHSPNAHGHGHPSLRTQRDPLNWSYDVIGRKIELKGLGKMRKHDDRFLQRKPHADAHARARAEGNVSEPVDAVAIDAEEPVGIEVVGRLPKGSVAMKQKWGN